MSAAVSSRYDTILKLASGGMATVWVGTVRGALGFRQLVAIKKPHPHLLDDASYRHELVAEARLASLIRHANVVDVRDVEVDGESISLVMDYIEGASLGELVVAAAKAGKRLPPRVAVRIALDALAGLHAAHELVDERGRHVGLVHRDVSPQNIVVGLDGLARVADFGVAKFSRKNVESSEGSLKGKLAYMAPEYIRGEPIDRRFDVFALGIVLWETLVGKRLFRGTSEPETIRLLLEHDPESLTTAAPAAAALDAVLATALARPVEQRFQNAQAMAAALESSALAAGLCGGHTEVSTTLKELVGGAIEERRSLIRAKLAHEPSVASLMGAAPAPSAPAPTTLSAPATTLSDPTPMLGASHPSAQANNATLPTATEPMGGATVLDPPTIVPSTLPMTPRMEGAPAQRTLASAEASRPPPAPPEHHVGGSTLPSAAPGSDPSLGSHHMSPRVETQLSFNDPSARTAHELEPAPQPPRSKTLSVLAGIAVALVASVAVAFMATRPRSASSGAEPAVISSASSDAPRAPASTELPTTTTESTPPSTSPSATVSSVAEAAKAPAPPATGRRVRGPTKGGAGAPAAARTTTASASAPASPPPLPPPTATGKKPPPNPYANQ